MSVRGRTGQSFVALTALWAAVAAAIPAAASSTLPGSRMLLSLLAVPAATLLVLRLRGGRVCPRCRDNWGWSNREQIIVEAVDGGWKLMRRVERSCSSCGASQLLQEPVSEEP